MSRFQWIPLFAGVGLWAMMSFTVMPSTVLADEETLEFDSLDEELFEGLDDGEGGEDIRSGSGDESSASSAGGGSDNPVVRISNKMRQVKERLSERDLSPATRKTQVEIVKELDALLKQALKQQQSQKSKPSKGASKPGEGKKPEDQKSRGSGGAKGGSGNAESGTGKSPGTKSEEGIRDMDSAEATLGRVLDNAMELWGDLPAKDRELMREKAKERLLPGYSRLIERYFQSLADDKEDSP